MGKKITRVVLAFVIIGVVIGGLVGFNSVWNSIFGSDAQKAAVGDCMQNKGTASDPKMESVDCGSSAATYQVSEVHDDTSDTSVCDKKYSAYTESTGGRRHRSSVVLCLTHLK
ncbi:LppU/SCO3897 family protein [Streptomyces celluloflavus]|uniref:LppU/SCO3897 family protein n=1 Tax=Streptomyces celluloflavus TaxID=58344 RepID=UPI0036612F94